MFSTISITKDNFQTVREQGIGNGFTVLNPADGFRQDNRLWFGKCSNCNETVTNSSLDGKGWMHSIHSVKIVPSPNGDFELNSYKDSEFCPKG